MMKIVALISFVLMLSWLSGGCARKNAENQLAEDREKVEKSISAFNPAYFRDNDRKHITVFFDIVDGNLSISPRPAEIRPGRLPFRAASAGPFLVVYKNAEGKELGRYATEDPTVVRGFDSSGDNKPSLKSIRDGTIEILLTANPAIATVEIGRIDGEPRSFSVSEQVKNARPPGK